MKLIKGEKYIVKEGFNKISGSKNYGGAGYEPGTRFIFEGDTGEYSNHYALFPIKGKNGVYAKTLEPIIKEGKSYKPKKFKFLK